MLCALLGVCVSTRRGDIAQKILHQLDHNAILEKPDPRILPDETTCVCLLNLYEATHDMAAAERLVFGDSRHHSYLELWGLRVNIKMYNALFGVCASTEQGNIAQKILLKLDANVMSMRPNWRILPTETTCTCLLSVYEVTQNTDAAERLVFGNDDQPESYLNRWRIAPSYLIYAHWALVGDGKMPEKLAILREKNICQSKLGLSEGSFNCHVGAIFNTKSKKANKGIPFKFALALYKYHSQKTTITKVITGYHFEHKLRDQFIQFLKNECKRNVKVDQDNPGVLAL